MEEAGTNVSLRPATRPATRPLPVGAIYLFICLFIYLFDRVKRLNGEIIEQAGTNVSLRLATRPLPVGVIYRGRQGAAFISVPLAGCC